jgi:hypothetical protein
MTLLLICASRNANAQIFSQDLTMHSTTTSSGMAGRGGGASTGTDYYSKSALKTSSSDGNDTIIRFDAEKIITIDNKKKTYTEMTFKQLQDMLSMLGSGMGADREGMEQMKKMMGQVDSAITLSKQGPGEDIAGYATEKYLLTGPIQMEIWSAPNLKIPAAYYDVMKIQMPPNPMFDMKKIYDEMKKINGMALKTVMTIKMMNMEMKTTKVVNSVDAGAIPASVFEVPSGYKLVAQK